MKYPSLWSAEVEARVRKEARNLDPQTPPAEIRMCTRCVVTNQRPRIVFDAQDVCSACRYAERKRDGIDWDDRREQLQELLARHRKPHGYDVVVPCSGGKDSAFVADTLRQSMHPLCARWAPFIATEIGQRNFDRFVQSGFDVVTAAPNGLLHRKLSRLAFEFYGDPFQPFVYGQLAWPMHVAAQNGVRLVFFGENGEAEYGGDSAANDKPCWDTADWARIYSKNTSVAEMIEIGRQVGAFSDNDARQLSPFYTPPLGQKDDWPEFHWLGYYLPWHPQANYYHAAEHTGFEANEERSEGTYSKYASLDDKLDGLHYYMAYVKFGIGRCTSDAAHEVRDGDLTCDEALALVKKYDGELPVRHLAECFEYLGLSRGGWDQIIERFRGPQVSLNRAA